MYEVIVNRQENTKKIILLENKVIIEKYEDNDESIRTEGNIYLGKVQNVLPGMQAAFVDIGEKKNTFIHLKDLLPKIDAKNENMEQNIETPNIKQLIKPGMPLLVQVKKDSTNKKGARVSTHISLPGKYIVFMPNAQFITVSQKIEDEKEKQRLIEVVKNLLPEGSGAIIRTSSENKDESTIKKDIDELKEEWKNIQNAQNNTKQYPAILYKNDGILKKLFIDMVDKKIDKIIVNDSDIYEDIISMLKDINNLNIKVELHNGQNLIEEFCLTSQIEKISNRKVWLKCGGFITIDKTEALTAIDVNSGKYIGTKDLEQTVYIVNKEATKEIAKQLRVRDIGGIVVIDYIDMKLLENRKKIEELLVDELKKDRSKTQVIGFTKLNLLEMTRKHIGSNE
mgnify:CR=1 FL=1